MKNLLWLIVGIGVLTGRAAAAGPEAPVKTAPPAELSAAVEAQAVARATIAKDLNGRREAVKKWFPTALDALEREATARGNLDGVLAVKEERGRADRPLTAAEMAKLPEPLHSVRLKYDQMLAALAAEQTAREAASVRDYITALGSLEKRTTQRGEIDNALKVREELGKARSELTQLDALKSPSTPPGQASTPAPVVGVAAPTPAPKAAPLATPPAVAQGAPSHPALIGTWHFTWTQTGYETNVTFAADGTFKPKDGGPAGTWKVSGNQIRMEAANTADKIIYLPINPKGTRAVDERKNREIKAVKLKP